MVVVALVAVVSRAEDRDSRRSLRRCPRTASRGQEQPRAAKLRAKLGGAILRADDLPINSSVPGLNLRAVVTRENARGQISR